MPPQGYTMPPPPPGSEVINLVPEDAKANQLTPNTPVMCINRGRKPIVDKFDGRDFSIPPGHFTTEYGAAVHFKGRAIVPGTRNLEFGSFQSYIGILNVDRPEDCEPFSDEQLERMGEKVEAIDRSALSSREAREVTTIDTGFARSTMRGQGAGRGVQIGTEAQISEEAAERAGHVFDPVDVSDAQLDERAARQELGEPAAPAARGGRGSGKRLKDVKV